MKGSLPKYVCVCVRECVHVVCGSIFRNGNFGVVSLISLSGRLNANINRFGEIYTVQNTPKHS